MHPISRNRALFQKPLPSPNVKATGNANNGYTETAGSAKSTVNTINRTNPVTTNIQSPTVPTASGNQSVSSQYNTYQQALAQQQQNAKSAYDRNASAINSMYGNRLNSLNSRYDEGRAALQSAYAAQQEAIRKAKENAQRQAYISSMRYAIKELDLINTAGAMKFGDKWKELSLTEDEINAFGKIKAGDTEAIKDIYDSVGKRIAKEYPATMWEKFVEATKVSMLFHTRTHIRNTVSNAILLPIRSLTDRVSAIGMNAAHIINPDIKVTQSLTGSFGGKYKKAAEEVWESVKDGIVGTENKWDDLSRSVFRKQVFKDSKAGTFAKEKGIALIRHLGGDKLENLANTLDENLKGSFLENLRNFNYYMLGEIEDTPFVKKNFVNRLASYMKAQGITDVSQVPDEAISLATTEALKATFKDDNFLTQKLSGIKSGWKLGEVIFPFTKTPANIAMRGIDYSPAGVIQTLKSAKDNGASATFDALSKNVVGTSAIYLGYLLAKNGLIQGALSADSDEKEFQKQQGKQAFSVNLNGTSYTFDWAQPASISMIIGAVIYQSIAEDDKNNQSKLQKIGNYALQGAYAAGNAWLELSPLQSLADIFDASYGKTPMQNLVNEVAEMPSRLFPAAVNAVANTIDPNQRITYTKNDTIGNLADTAQAKVPFVRETLPQAYDTWGNPKVNANSTGQAFFNNFISPGKSVVNASTPIDSEIQRLYDVTGNKAVFPRKAEWTLNNTQLDNYAYSEAQKAIGQLSYDLAENFINSDSYANMSDEDKAEMLGNLYGFANARYSVDNYGANMSSKYQKYNEMYEYGGVEAVTEYINYDNALGELKDTDKMRNIWNEKGGQGIEQYQRIRSSCLKTNSDGDQSVDKDLLMQNLINSDMSEEEKGYWYRHIAKQTDKDDTAFAELGYWGVYRYQIYKIEADKPSGKENKPNGQLTMKEVVNYLATTNMSRQEKHDWYNILVPIDDIPKNPY